MPAQEKTIIAQTLYGKTKEIPVSRFKHRNSTYAVIVHEGKLLVQNTRFTGRYALPGGGIDIGETIPEALRREVREEAGIEVEVGEFLHFADMFFYYDPQDVAFHGFMFFYRCTPLTFDLHTLEDVQDNDVAAPEWVDLATLKVEDFQYQPQIMMPFLPIIKAL